jgi:hypothetical protein
MQKPPLFRPVNTKARGVHHRFGGSYKHERNTKEAQRSDAARKSMHGKVRRGLDYTPLFKFLLSKVGASWNDIHAEAVTRLDRPDPMFWLVALHEHERREYVCVGEASYYSGLYVDADGRLQIVNPNLGPSSLSLQCGCCTHTFNGVRFTKPFNNPRETKPEGGDAT